MYNMEKEAHYLASTMISVWESQGIIPTLLENIARDVNKINSLNQNDTKHPAEVFSL